MERVGALRREDRLPEANVAAAGVALAAALSRHDCQRYVSILFNFDDDLTVLRAPLPFSRVFIGRETRSVETMQAGYEYAPASRQR